MSEPASKEEYERLYVENYKVTGFGIEGVTNHFPCPFCAAPEWQVIRVIDLAVPEEPGTYRGPTLTCTNCGRSAAHVSTRSGDGLTMGIVQTDGPDAPEWVPIRRERN